MSTADDGAPGKHSRSSLVLTALFCAFAAAVALVGTNGIDFLSYMAGFATGQVVPGDSFMYIPPYVTEEGAPVFADDPNAVYFRLAHSPQGYDLLYRFLGAHTDIRQTAIGVTFLLLAVTVYFTARTGHLLAGWPGAICAVLIIVCSISVMRFAMGGLPRSFGLPLTAMAIYGLCSGRLGYVIAATILGTLFYYMVGVLSGFALLLYCLLPQSARPENADLPLMRRVVILAVTGAVSLAILGASLSRDHGFGPVIGPEAYSEFPEAGPEGRYWLQWNGVARDLAEGTMATFDATARQSTRPTGVLGLYLQLDRAVGAQKVTFGFALLALFALVAALAWRRELIGLLLMLGAACLLYLAAIAFFPLLFFPARFFQVAVPITTALLFAWAGRQVLLWARPTLSGAAQTGLLALAVAALLIVSGRPQWPGPSTFSEPETQILNFVSDLPKDSLIAGWPRDKIMNAIPYASKRSVLLNYETHLPLREGFARSSRERMTTLIDAIVIGQPDAFARLQQEFGVTHILLNDGLIAQSRFGYFAPFQDRLEALEDHGAGYALLRSGALGPILFETGDMAVVELSGTP